MTEQLVTPASLRERYRDCCERQKIAERALMNAMNAAIEAEIAFYDAACDVMRSEGDPQKMIGEYTKRAWFLRAKQSDTHLRSTIRKILGASRWQRLLTF